MTGRWSPEDIETCRDMYLAGKTYGEIAKVIGKGYTRRAISGAVHRLKESGGITDSPNRTTDKTAKMTLVRMENKKVREETAKKPPSRFDLTGESIIPLAGIGLSLEAVSSRNECRYPYGSPNEDGFHFCGLPIDGDSSYCSQHSKICHVPQKPGARISEQDKALIAANARASGLNRAFGG